MKLRKLNFQIGGVIITVALTITILACNGNDKSVKDSTTKNDTVSTAPAVTTETAIKPKRKGKASTAAVTTAESNKTTKMTKDKMGYYNYTEVAPVYPGGQSALETYINNTIEYPQDAIDNNIQGTVNVQFVIDENGNVSSAKETGAKLGYGLDEEAIKVVSQMPKWTPGKVKGKNVKAWYTLPITYQIEES